MRNIYRKLEFDAKNVQSKSEALREGHPLPEKELEKKRTMLQKDGVGDLDDIGEFGLGIAPRLAKPVNKIEISKERQEEINKMQADDEDPTKNIREEEEESDSKLEIIRLKKQREKKRKPIDR